MLLDKEGILALIRERRPDLARQAEQELPAQIDDERDADLLRKFGVDPQEAVDQFGGAGGVSQSSGGPGDAAAGGVEAAARDAAQAGGYGVPPADGPEAGQNRSADQGQYQEQGLPGGGPESGL